MSEHPEARILRLEPGDKLLFEFPGNTPLSTVDEIRGRILREFGEGFPVLVTTGGVKVSVVRGDG